MQIKIIAKCAQPHPALINPLVDLGVPSESLVISTGA
jgi:hypothetical protein